MSILELHHVHKTYAHPQGAVRALEDVSLQLDPGDFTAVQGPSGCGKSTLLLISGGLLLPDEGTVKLNSRDLYALSQGERAQRRARDIGFVFQQFHLIPYLTVLDNILAATLATDRTPDKAERARDLACRLGLHDRLQHVPSELSVGERQRTALARALLNDPVLLLADEPTGNLDQENGALVLGQLAAFARQGGAVLLVTHDPRAAQYARRRVRMAEGRIAETSRVGEEAAGG